MAAGFGAGGNKVAGGAGGRLTSGGTAGGVVGVAAIGTVGVLKTAARAGGGGGRIMRTVSFFGAPAVTEPAADRGGSVIRTVSLFGPFRSLMTTSAEGSENR